MTKTNTYTRTFTDAEVTRLARLSTKNDFKAALDEIIDEMFKANVGLKTIRSTSQGNTTRVTAPSIQRGN